MKKILLVNAPRSAWWQREPRVGSTPPLGILSIATYISQRGHDVRLFDMEATPMTQAEFRAKLREFSPHIVGFTLTPTTWMNARSVISVINEELEKVRIVAGGNFPTFAAETLMAEEPNLDYVVIGEGELTFDELVNSFEGKSAYGLGQIHGLCYRDDSGKFVRTPPRSLVADLDSLPIPDRSFLNIPSYAQPFAISTARGCPAKCTFCSNSAMFGKFRVRSVNSVLQEIKYLVNNYNMNQFFIVDDTFTAQPSRLFEFCHRLRNEVNYPLMWNCESRADVMTPEMAKALRDAGCYAVNIGLESADNHILRKIQKNVTAEQVEYATDCVCKLGIVCQLSFIFGHPWDTHETMYHLINFAKRLKDRYPESVQLAPLVNTPFPGTYQYNHRVELGLNWHGKTWDDYEATKPFVSCGGFTQEELREIYMTASETFISGKVKT